MVTESETDYLIGVQCVTNNKVLTHKSKVLTMTYCQTLLRQDVRLCEGFKIMHGLYTLTLSVLNRLKFII